MPTPTLNLSSPYEKIFSTTPNYSKLKIFGCLCYPWLRPYTTNKLDTRSLPCVFLGYSLTQSAYYCLDPTTSKIYVSRHVRFVETVFPFTHLSAPTSSPHSNSIATWIPPPLRIPSLPLVPPLNPSSAVDAQQQPPVKLHHHQTWSPQPSQHHHMNLPLPPIPNNHPHFQTNPSLNHNPLTT